MTSESFRNTVRALRRQPALIRAVAFILLLFFVFGVCPNSSAASGDPDPDAQIVYMQPDNVYDVSSYNGKATYLRTSGGGEYTLIGESHNTLVEVCMDDNEEVTLKLNGVSLTPNDTAPKSNRCALTIQDHNGAVVHLVSIKGTLNSFSSYKDGPATACPAIRKDGIKTKLIFESTGSSSNEWGKIIAKASQESPFAPAIGNYSYFPSSAEGWLMGNIEFRSGVIEATGGGGYHGVFFNTFLAGPAIGGSLRTRVDGLYFTGAHVTAYSLNSSAAAIGNGWVDAMSSFGANPETRVSNIEISGGSVYAEIKAVNQGEGFNWFGAAAIGGGSFSGAKGIRITGGTVVAINNSTNGGAGIGGGFGSTGGTPDAPIEISGGHVTAKGSSNGIGAGSVWSNGSNRLEKSYAVINISGDAYVEATGDGGGIGGAYGAYETAGNENSVTISGGTVIAKGVATGIGGDWNANINRITISGGKVYAEATSKDGVGIGAYCEKNNKGTGILGKVEITGGRVEAVGKAGGIGGYSSNSWWHKTRPCEAIYISGGNVKTTFFEVTPKNRAGGKTVYCRNYTLIDYGHKIDCEKQFVTQFSSVPSSADVSGYGTHDMYPFTVDDKGDVSGLDPFGSKGSDVVLDEWAKLYIWLPAAYGVTDVTLSAPEGDTSADDVPLCFTGFDGLDPDWAYIHCRGVQTTLKSKTASLPNSAKNASDGKALLFYCHCDATDMKAAQANGYKLLGYLLEDSTDPAKIFMDPSGHLKPSVEERTDEQGRFIPTEPMIRNGLTLYALWEPRQYRIDFDPGKPIAGTTEPNGSITSKEVVGNEKTTLPQKGDAEMFTLPGYVFIGWGTSVEGGVIYKPGAEVSGLTDQDSITLFAQWEPLTYRNKYADTQGHYYTDTEDRVFDQPFTIPSFSDAGFTLPTGQTFIGWKQHDIVPGELYPEGSMVRNLCTINNETGAITGWQLDAYLTADSGLFSVSVTVDRIMQMGLDQSVMPHLTMKDANDPSSAEYTLFDSDSNGTYTIETAAVQGMDLYFGGVGTGITCTGAGTVTLELFSCSAAKDEHISSVKLAPSGSSGALLCDLDENNQISAVYLVGDTVNIEKGAVLKGTTLRFTAEPEPCYGLDYWSPKDSVSASGGNPASNPLEIAIQNPLNLKAISKTAEYTVRFDANGGDGTMADLTYQCNKTYTLPTCSFTSENFDFKGTWNTMPDGSGTTYADGASVTNLSGKQGAVVTLYAQWNASYYTIRYDANGGEGYMPDQHAFRGIPTRLSTNEFTRKLYGFENWSTNSDGTGLQFANDAEVVDLREKGDVITLYAQWLEIPDYRITYGAGSTWIHGSKTPQRFIANGELNKFTRLVIDGETVNSRYYTATSGSTIIDIEPRFMDRLSGGKHTLKMVYNNGETDTVKFYVGGVVPQTGDNNPLLPVAFLMMLSGLGLAAIIRKRKACRK